MLNVHVHANADTQTGSARTVSCWHTQAYIQIYMHTHRVHFNWHFLFKVSRHITAYVPLLYFRRNSQVVDMHEVETLCILIMFTLCILIMRGGPAQKPKKGALHLKYLHLYGIRWDRTSRDTERRWRNTEISQMCKFFQDTSFKKRANLVFPVHTYLHM